MAIIEHGRLKKVVVGTRASRLALWQTEWVVARLKERYPEATFEILHIKTSGDKILDSPLSAIGDRGLFVKEIEMALQNGEIDLAVHSMKDVPTQVADGLTIGVVAERTDPRDVLVSKKYRSLRDLPPRARLGTSSLRRVAQLAHFRPDLCFEPIRGNLDTRLRKLETLDLAGVVLAAAGLERMGWTQDVVERLDPAICLPAVGQGAIGVEIRADDHELLACLEFLNHPPTRSAVMAERAFLAKLEGGCQVPIGALGEVHGKNLLLRGVIVSLDGQRLVRGEKEGPVERAAELGKELAEELCRKGGQAILDEIKAEGERNGTRA